ncbi:Protein NDR1 [Linum perenne]
MLPPKFLNHSLSNSTVNFDLRLVNPNLNKGIYYDSIKVSYFHISNRSDSLGNFTISKFYQGHQKKATKDGTIGNATGAILRGGTAAGFRVEIATRVRYKLIFFKTKRRQIIVEADFEFYGKGIERGGGRREMRLNEEEVGGKGD